MLIRPIRDDEQSIYNQAVNHPLQTWQWGEFRQQTGQKLERIGFFENGQLKKAIQVTFHDLPVLNQTVGYLPRGFKPDEDQISALKQIAKQHQALFIKLEPNVAVPVDQAANHQELAQFLLKHDCQPGRPLFTKYTFQLDLTPAKDELFANLKSKTRYNVRLSRKKGVRIVEDSSAKGLETYLKILAETTSRQDFYAHTPDYFKKMWQQLKDSDLMHLFHAVYDDTVLVSWIMFKFKDFLYYPYGASRSIHRNVMASNLMMWEMISWGKSQGCKTFDMWGSLGPEAKRSNPWYGFHRFKQGYGGQLMKFVGTYDLVTSQPVIYKLFRLAENWRWKFLRLKARFS